MSCTGVRHGIACDLESDHGGLHEGDRSCGCRYQWSEFGGPLIRIRVGGPKTREEAQECFDAIMRDVARALVADIDRRIMDEISDRLGFRDA